MKAGSRVVPGSASSRFEGGGSEVELEPEPEQVAGLLERAGPVDDRIAEDGLLPVEVDLGVLVQVPVEAEVGHEDVVGPEVGIGESGPEDVPAEVDRGEPGGRLDRPEAELRSLEVERAERVDHAEV